MNIIVSPSDREPLISDAVSAELEHEDLSTSTIESQPSDSSQCPFHDLDSDELLEELWEEGADREFKTPAYCPKYRGLPFVLLALRTQFSEIVYRKLCQELCTFEPQDPGEIGKVESGVELGSAVGRSPY
jgi:hypothetical protein